jgi:adenylate cyclase
VKQHLVRILLGFAITLFFIGHVIGWYTVGFIDQVDNIIYDARLRLTAPGRADPQIVILDIDERSLAEVGGWPWSRALMARLVDKLFDDYGIAVLGFDVVWAEPDMSSGVAAIDALARAELKDAREFQSAYRRLRPRLDYDAAFATSLKNRPVVLGYYLSSEAPAVRVNMLPPPVLGKGAFSGRDVPLTRWSGYTGNLAPYVQNAFGAGHFNPIVDDDGAVRRVPLLAELDGQYYEAFSLALVRTLLALEQADRKPPEVRPGFPRSGEAGGYSRLEWLTVGRLTIPVDEQAAALVPYAGRRGTVHYLSLADVLAGRVESARLKGKVAIIGASAPGLLDLRSTPVDKVYPGVEIHANLVSGMYHGALKSKPGYMLGAEVAFVTLGGLVLSLLIPVLSAPFATMAAALGLGLITWIDLALWSEAGIVLPLAASVLMTAFIYSTSMAYGYFVEDRIKRRVAARFGQYVPPELVDRIVANPDLAHMEPKAAELTILFADVRGFTGISEALAPEELREYINQYLTDMSRIIRSGYRGTLDKYIGDAIMAFWGAPVEDPQHARNGVLAALDMQRECRVLNKKLTGRGWPALEIGVGVNTGSVRVGDMGSQVRRAYTAMGDAVNVASRLEARTKHYGVGILVGEATRAAANDVVFREIDRIKVKGRDTALTVYAPIGLESEVGPDRRGELRLWGEALGAYRARAWDDAEAKLEALRRADPSCRLYAVFSERIAELRRHPPAAGWDGVTVFAEK